MNLRQQAQPRARTDRVFRAWYLRERRRDRLAAGDVSATARLTEDSQERETEAGQLRETES